MAGFIPGYYVRTKGRFDPTSAEPFRLSRSKIDLFVECPRCFYIDQRFGCGRPKSFPFNLNNAVDTLMKKEFDTHRVDGTVHPLVKAYGLPFVPLKHKDLDLWRDAMRNGISFNYQPANLIVRGGIDDVWHDPSTGEIVIVDYKATSKEGEVSLDADWQVGYKRQIEIYQWLFMMNGFKVSPTGYFVYVNGKTDAASFDAKLEFDLKLIPYTGKTDWIPRTLDTLAACLRDDRIPLASKHCEYCGYINAVCQTADSRVKPMKMSGVMPAKTASSSKSSKTTGVAKAKSEKKNKESKPKNTEPLF